MKTNPESAHFLKIVEWSEEDGCFVGSAPPLIGPCCHGMDERKVFNELCQIVDEWVSIFKEDGRPLPQSLLSRKFSGKFMVRISPETHRRLAAKAELEGESLNQYASRALVKA